MRSTALSSLAVLMALVALPACRSVPQQAMSVTYPVTPQVFIDQFEDAEGITFNGEGHLFIGADRAVWIVRPDGAATKIADVTTNLGQARIGARDILAADFGPTNAFRHGPNDDGVVWRITPEGEKSVAATGIADPNFVLMLPDGSYLVSDDGVASDAIWRVRPGENPEVYPLQIAYPNGMALSIDRRTLFVAQIFSQLKPITFDNRVWAVPLTRDYTPAGPPQLLARVGEGGVDGLAIDVHGMLYVADNRGGRIWRVDPDSGEAIVIAAGLPNVASLVFGEGDFDPEAIYATSTERGGGTIWKVPVGVRGAPLFR